MTNKFAVQVCDSHGQLCDRLGSCDGTFGWRVHACFHDTQRFCGSGHTFSLSFKTFSIFFQKPIEAFSFRLKLIFYQILNLFCKLIYLCCRALWMKRDLVISKAWSHQTFLQRLLSLVMKCWRLYLGQKHIHHISIIGKKYFEWDNFQFCKTNLSEDFFQVWKLCHHPLPLSLASQWNLCYLLQPRCCKTGELKSFTIQRYQ